MSKVPVGDDFYYGCRRKVEPYWGGHHFYYPSGELAPSVSTVATYMGYTPHEVDGHLAPFIRGHTAGVSLLAHKGEWTSLGYWDPTGHDHPNSVSTFFTRATLDWEEAVKHFQAQFPWVFEPQDFLVLPHNNRTIAL